MGFEFEEPPPIRCRWCGKPLTPLGVELLGQVRWLMSETCGCEGEIAEHERTERVQQAEQERNVAERVVAAGVTGKFANARTSIPAIGDFLLGFDRHGGNGLYISGIVGSGKTHAVSALARALVYEGHSVVLTNTLAMLDSIRATYGRDGSQSGGVGRFTGCHHVPGSQRSLRGDAPDRGDVPVSAFEARRKTGQVRGEGKRRGDRIEALRDVRHRDPPRHRPPEGQR